MKIPVVVPGKGIAAAQALLDPAFASKRNNKWGLYVKTADGAAKEELIIESEQPKRVLTTFPHSSRRIVDINTLGWILWEATLPWAYYLEADGTIRTLDQLLPVGDFYTGRDTRALVCEPPRTYFNAAWISGTVTPSGKIQEPCSV
jgi:hypothetical protein